MPPKAAALGRCGRAAADVDRQGGAGWPDGIDGGRREPR